MTTSHTRKALSASIIVGAVLSASLSAAPALAAPDQGGVIPQDGPEQGGVIPDSPPPAAPAPAPAAPSSPPPVTYEPGPGLVPAPQMEAPYQPAPSNPTYPNAYSPALPAAPLAPKRVPPVRPKAPAPGTLRIGNWVTPVKSLPREIQANPRAIVSANEWAAYTEAKIAQGLISVGVPPDEASRRAAATVIGVVLGGTGGALAAGVPAAMVGAAGGALIGGIAGTAIGTAIQPGAGTAVGLAAGVTGGAALGAAVLGVPAAAAGALAGGTVGGLIAYTFGAGDPGAHSKQPQLPWQQPSQPPSTTTPAAPNAGPIVFQVHLPAPAAKSAGLPAVDYSVTARGDVTGSAQVGGQSYTATLPAAAAKPAYDALGPSGQRQAQQLTQRATQQLQHLVPGVKVTIPPLPAPPKPKGRNR